MQEGKLENKYFILYGILFVIVWLCGIFWFDKDEFDLEFKEKATTTAIINKLEPDQIVEEFDDAREINVYDVDYLEYSYTVNGEKYEYGGQYPSNSYSVSDEIEIEYVKANPSNSTIKGENNYTFNFFIRNLIMYSIYALLLTLCFSAVLKLFKKSERFSAL